MTDSRPTTNPVPAPVTVGVAAAGPCIIWTGYLNPNGYGQRWVGERMVLAHRHAWALVHGDPGKLCVLHRCDNPSCVNVAHLFLGTPADNMADKVAKGRQSRLPGERNGYAKLTVDQVREIRSSTENGAAIGRRFGVDRTTVSKIRSRKRWAHIPEVEGNQPRLPCNKGERHPSAKLTADQVREIRASPETGAVIARRLGITKSTVSKIRSHKKWVHIL